VKYLLLYVLTFVAFMAIDMIWLGTMTSRFYRPQLGDMLRPSPNWIVAVCFYLAYVVGVLVLAVLPGHDSGELWRATLYGALLGFVAYGTYDLTNLSALKGFPAVVAVVDLAWGTVLTAATATIGYFLAGRLL